MSLRIGSTVWGTRDLPRAIAFWTGALDYELLRDPSDDWAIIVPREGTGYGAQLAFQLVEQSPEHRRRHHLDLYATDQAAEVARLTALGATSVDWEYEADADYVVLADPDGNLFCVIDAPDDTGAQPR